MKIETINSHEQFKSLIEKKAFILFSADYCPGCKIFSLILEKMKKNNKWKKTIIYYFDTVLLSETAEKEKIRSIPSLRFYKKNILVEQLKKYSENDLNEFIEKNEN